MVLLDFRLMIKWNHVVYWVFSCCDCFWSVVNFLLNTSRISKHEVLQKLISTYWITFFVTYVATCTAQVSMESPTKNRNRSRMFGVTESQRVQVVGFKMGPLRVVQTANWNMYWKKLIRSPVLTKIISCNECACCSAAMSHTDGGWGTGAALYSLSRERDVKWSRNWICSQNGALHPAKKTLDFRKGHIRIKWTFPISLDKRGANKTEYQITDIKETNKNSNQSQLMQIANTSETAIQRSAAR